MFDTINNATGFANGNQFNNADEVFAYFTRDVQVQMFEQDAVTNQDQLDEWAAIVIEHGWHMCKA